VSRSAWSSMERSVHSQDELRVNIISIAQTSHPRIVDNWLFVSRILALEPVHSPLERSRRASLMNETERSRFDCRLAPVAHL
jgi:hypothetical protein